MENKERRDSYVVISHQDMEKIDREDESKKRERERNKSESDMDDDMRSPNSKRDKKCSEGSDYKDMQTSEDVKAFSSIITIMDSNANKETMKLVACFIPGLRDNPEEVIDLMLKCSKNWKNRKGIFIGAIEFIAHEQNSRMDNKLEEKSIEQLSEILVVELLNRLSRYCKDCDSLYTIKLETIPEIRCSNCNVGRHDCDISKLNFQNEDRNQSKGEEMKKSSFYWFCDECEPNIKNHLHKQDRFANFTGFKRTEKTKEQTSKNRNSEIVEIEDDDQNHPNFKDKENKKTKVDEQPSTPIEVDIIEVPLKKKNEDDQKKKTLDGEEPKENDKESREECRVWKVRSRCKFGEICNYEHKDKCENIMKDGVCNDQMCKLKHPEVCYSMWYQSQCSRRNCKFVHPSNMQRKQRNQGPRSYNARNKYHENYGYDTEGFFGYQQDPWNMRMPMRGRMGAQNGYLPQYPHTHYHAYHQPHQYPYPFQYPFTG